MHAYKKSVRDFIESSMKQHANLCVVSIHKHNMDLCGKRSQTYSRPVGLLLGVVRKAILEEYYLETVTRYEKGGRWTNHSRRKDIVGKKPASPI